MRFTVQDHLTEKIFFALSNAFAFLCVRALFLFLFSALGQFIPVILSSFPRSDCDRGKRHRSASHNIVVRHTRDHHRANSAQSMWHLVTISPLMTRVTVLSGTAIASPPSARREMHALPCALSWKLIGIAGKSIRQHTDCVICTSGSVTTTCWPCGTSNASSTQPQLSMSTRSF